MTPEEWAHWRYRLTAISRELEELDKRIKSLNEWSTRLKVWQSRGITDSHELRVIAQTKMRPDVWADDLKVYITANEYLLEEARYKCELGGVLNS